MKKLYFITLLASWLAIISIPSASAEISTSVDFQRYGARNLNRNESTYSQNITALEGNELEFSVNIRNASSNQASGAVLYVYLPIGFPLDTNSIYIDGTRTGGNISNGLFLGNINGNAQKDVIFKTKINGYFSGYVAIQALVVGDNFNSSSQYVSVTKNGSINNNTVSSFTPAPTPVPSPTPNPTLNPTPTPILTNQNNILGVSVLGKNLTKQDVNWQKVVKAEPGDLLQFSIMLTANTSLTARNVYVKDTLDSFLDFISDSLTINNISNSNALLNSQFFVGNITSQEAKFIKFQARVQHASQFGKDPIILSNTVQAWAENNSLTTDASSVSVSIKQVVAVKSAATIASSQKNNGSASVAVAKKLELVVPKATTKTASKNSLLGGAIVFGSFWLLIILILIALIILLVLALVHEKKKNKNLALNQSQSTKLIN